MSNTISQMDYNHNDFDIPFAIFPIKINIFTKYLLKEVPLSVEIGQENN